MGIAPSGFDVIFMACADMTGSLLITDDRKMYERAKTVGIETLSLRDWSVETGLKKPIIPANFLYIHHPTANRDKFSLPSPGWLFLQRAVFAGRERNYPEDRIAAFKY